LFHVGIRAGFWRLRELSGVFDLILPYLLIAKTVGNAGDSVWRKAPEKRGTLIV
jgi:hypothetical protein